LIVEKEIKLANTICNHLNHHRYFCEMAHTYGDALRKIELFDYDCILLNTSQGNKMYSRLLIEIKAMKKTDGIIVISDTDSLEEKIRYLQTGADDYLSKPFHLSELAARIFSLIRRKQFNGYNLFNVQEMQVDIAGKKVTVCGNALELTKREYNILMYLISHKNRVVSKSAIAEHLGGDMEDTVGNSDFVYSHIKNIKKKLMQAGCPGYIESMYGMGYKLSVPA
ncbi:MAG: response regulator transcription factor, partial [Bacteroidota bacterium]|nr:response regulator transcription factor [Bacteroidota bacterium]